MATLLDHSVGIAIEATQNVATTAAMRFYEWLPSSGLDWDPDVQQGKGLRQGSRVARAGRRVSIIPRGGGKLEMELVSKGLGIALQALFGTGTSTLVSGSTYQQVFTPTTSGSTLPSITVQEGIVRADGTLRDHTFSGCTVKSGEIEMPQDGIGMLKLDVDARGYHTTRSVSDGVTTITSPTFTSATANFTLNDVGKTITATGIPAATTILAWVSATTVTLSANASATGAALATVIGLAYATPSYPAAPVSLFTSAFPQSGAVIIGGTLTVPTATALGSTAGGTNGIGLKEWTLSIDNNIDDKREVIGGRNQPTTAMRGLKLKAKVEYDANTGEFLRDMMVNQTPAPLLLTASTPFALSAGVETLQIAIPAVYVDKGAVPGPDDGTTVVTDVEFAVLDNLIAAQPLYLVMRTADTAL